MYKHMQPLWINSYPRISWFELPAFLFLFVICNLDIALTYIMTSVMLS